MSNIKEDFSVDHLLLCNPHISRKYAIIMSYFINRKSIKDITLTEKIIAGKNEQLENCIYQGIIADNINYGINPKRILDERWFDCIKNEKYMPYYLPLIGCKFQYKKVGESYIDENTGYPVDEDYNSISIMTEYMDSIYLHEPIDGEYRYCNMGKDGIQDFEWYKIIIENDKIIYEKINLNNKVENKKKIFPLFLWGGNLLRRKSLNPTKSQKRRKSSSRSKSQKRRKSLKNKFHIKSL